MDSSYCGQLFSVRDQVVAITGGGGILCGTMAKGLARAGAKIAILDLSDDRAHGIAREITEAGGDALAMCVDCVCKEPLQEAAAQIIAHYGRVDALINGAGGNRPKATTTPELRFFDLPQDAFQQVFNLNFMGTLLASQIFGRHMAERGEGSIINIASVNAIVPLTKIPAYSAAKAAVKNLTEWLAVHMSQEYSPRIRVNGIAPGFFLTPQNYYLLLDQATGQPTPRGQSVLSHTPMGCFGDPEDLLSTVIWLLSPASRFVHGITIAVDGGFTTFSGV